MKFQLYTKPVIVSGFNSNLFSHVSTEPTVFTSYFMVLTHLLHLNNNYVCIELW